MSQNEEKTGRDHRKYGGHCGSGVAGAIWVIGWLFTIGYAQLVWWQIILGIAVWPYYLSLALR